MVDGIHGRTALYKDSIAYPHQRLICQCIPSGSALDDWLRDTLPGSDRCSIPPMGLTAINKGICVSALERRDTSLLYDGEPNASYPRWGMFAGAFGSRWNIFDFRSGFRKVIYVQIILVRM